MRAMVFDDYGGPEVLYQTALAEPQPGPGEIRIRVHAAAVNPADTKWRAGMFRGLVPVGFPHVLGYDVAGVIDLLGPQAGGFAVGDAVLAMLDPVTKGGYAELAIARASSAARCPEGLSHTVAAALPTAGLTGFQMIDQHIQPQAGQTVLITGATGAVGRFALHAALAAGARVIAAVRGSQLEEALRLGADEAILLDTPPARSARFDHVADTVGGPGVARLCHAMAPGGRIRTVATTPIDPEGLPAVPQFFAVTPDSAQLERIAAAVAASRIAVPIDQELPIEAAAAAHRLVEAGGLRGKVILKP